MTKKEIRKYFRDATQGVRAGNGGRGKVTREMIERDEITRTMEKVREGLPRKVTRNHVLVKRAHAVSK